MKALVYHGNGLFKFEERPIPKPKSEEVVVKVHSSSICGTDIHIIDGVFSAELPLVIGHEFSGEVFEVGEKVTEAKIGTRVAVETIFGCGNCYFCRRHTPHFCSEYKELGVTVNGAWQEYVALPVRNVHPISENVSYEEGSLIEPLDCTLGALERSHIEINDDVLILGAGPAGLFFTQITRLKTAGKIIIAGKRKERLNLAKDYGADWVIDIEKEDLKKQVNKITDGLGPHVVIEAVGSEESIATALDIARPEGNVILYGVGGGKKIIDTDKIVLKMLSIMGDQSSSYCWQSAVRLVELGKVNVSEMITHRFKFEDTEEAIKVFRKRIDGAIKVVINMV